MSGILNIIVAGGCGISIASKVVTDIETLGEGFSTVKVKYIDTSDNSIKYVDHDPKDFFLIETKSISGSKISGAGGERNSSITGDVVVNTKEFLDKYKFVKPVTGEFTVVLFGASGGTGSNIGSLLVGELLKRNIPVIAIVVGDSSSLLYTENTLKVLDGLNRTSRSLQKGLTLFYVNNNTMGLSEKKKDKDLSIEDKENMSNRQIRNLLTGLSLFCSGVNESLDYKDMENFFSPHNYATVKMPAGLYNLCLSTSMSGVPGDLTIMMARSLTDGSPVNLEGVVLQTYKNGKIGHDNVKEVYGDKFPLFLISGINYLDGEIEYLTKQIGSLKNIASSIKINDFTSGGEVDENGLIF